VGKVCKAPEDIPGMPKEISDFFGKSVDAVAEEMIFDDYCFRRAINEFGSIFPKRNFDGAQIFRDVTGLNTQLFIAYLKENNPAVDEVSLSKQALMAGGGIKNPDWMIHRTVRAEFEFYEVKPDSSSSKSKGRAKILALIALCGLNNLPYVPGLRYSPVDEEKNLWIETKGFIETEVTLRWSRIEPGLIAYQVCVQRRARNPLPKPVAKAVDETAKLLLIIIIVAGAAGGAPVPAPL
jgi:hypothetical protein